MQIFIKILLIVFFTSFSKKTNTWEPPEDINTKQLWIDCRLETVLSFEVFNTAVTGYRKLGGFKKENLITIIDYSKPSTEKRFFVLDIENKKLLYRCYVAHGKNSGNNYADSFSNESKSLKSSLGFFITGETYSGNNGYSLKLDGLEKYINDNARAREIVIHGAEYVSEEFIRKYGRLGRSWGCPALPADISKEIIDKISKWELYFYLCS